MDDILFQLELAWSLYEGYVSTIEYENVERTILIRLWSIQFFWKSVLNASFGNGEQYVFFADDIKTLRDDIQSIHNSWIECMNMLSKEELYSTKYCKWPFDNRSFYSLALWVNLELMKYAVEIGMIKEKTVVHEPLL